MKKIIPFLIIFLAVSTIFVETARAQADENLSVSAVNKPVKAIEVVGNKTISIATILSKIKTRVGQDYIQAMISDDLKRLYNTGYFSDVRVDRQEQDGGFKVIIYIEEKPIIEEITFSKTRHVKNKAIKRKLKSQVGRFLDNKSVKDDINTIKDLYAKKGLNDVEIELEKFVDEATNKITLHFVIREGQKIRIKAINIYGNNSYSDKKVLKLLKTKDKFLFINQGYLKEDLLKEDMDRIIAFYEQNGYIDAKASYSIEQLYKGYINVNIEVVEGKRYSVGSVSVAGNQIISDKEVNRVMTEIEEGGVFSRAKLTVDVQNIRTLYFDKGYIFANVNESTSLDTETGKVSVRISIDEGGLAYIEQIKVQGNTRTRDIVIRRELKMLPGDRFDGAKLRRSKDRLNNLGYFEEVGFDIEDTDTYDRKDLVVQVKEAKTGTFSFGGGFSTVDQVVGFIEVQQRNFDFTNWPTFTGGGQQLTVRAETGSNRNNYRLSFTEPWIFDHPVSGGFDIYRTERDRDEDTGYAYDEQRTGGGLRLGKRFTDYFSGNLAYKIEEVSIENLQGNVSSALSAELGTNTVSQLGFDVTEDRRDNVFSPTKGFVLNGGIDVAGGIFGADKDFYRIQGSASYFVPLKWKSVLEMRVKAGIVENYGDSDRVPIFERFFAGGARTIRGYDERDVGPKDPSTQDSVGGESIVVGNVEYTIPIIEFIKLAGFFDIGNVGVDANDIADGSFKPGAGLGLRVKTPIGPVKLDYGYPLKDEPGTNERDGKFYFSVSRGF